MNDVCVCVCVCARARACVCVCVSTLLDIVVTYTLNKWYFPSRPDERLDQTRINFRIN
jgi:hypothetical protein